jgi:UDP-glucose 4-epimerase
VTTPSQFQVFFGDRPVCVTGGAGFIGSHLVAKLVGHGAKVTVIDDLSNGRLSNLDEALPGQRDAVRFVEASLLDEDRLRDAASEARTIFHLAAVASVPRSVQEPELFQRVNTMGTLAVLEAARHGAAERVVLSSSSSVYGDQARSPKVESMRPEPMSPYAASKAAAEQLARAYACCYPLSTVSLRYFNVFGPRQRVDSPYAAVIPKFVDAMSRGVRPVVFGDGLQSRDFTHVANAVHANLLAGSTKNALQGETINVAMGAGSTVLDLLQRTADLVEVSAEYDLAPPRPGEVRHSCADLTAASELLDYEPVMEFEQGLEETVRYYVELLAAR